MLKKWCGCGFCMYVGRLFLLFVLGGSGLFSFYGLLGILVLGWKEICCWLFGGRKERFHESRAIGLVAGSDPFTLFLGVVDMF